MIVYLLRNESNGKCYIGQTKQKVLSKRWNQKLNNTQMNAHLQAAISKYGPESFSRTVLVHASCQAEADLLEKFFILIYQATDRRFGYNLQSGGRQGPGRHIEDVKERIRKQLRTVWAGKSTKERWEFAFDQKLRWLNRTEEEREQIGNNITKSLVGKPRLVPPWNKGLSWNKGLPSPRKGRRFGPQKHPCLCWPPKSEEHKKNISEGLKMYFAQKSRLPPKKPCTGTRSQPWLESPRNGEETRALAALKEVQEQERKLREIKGRLDHLKFELEGGCTW